MYFYFYANFNECAIFTRYLVQEDLSSPGMLINLSKFYIIELIGKHFLSNPYEYECTLVLNIIY